MALVEAAVQAPSADNRHSFTVEVAEEAIRLWVADNHVHPPFHRRVLNAISVGAAIENVVLRAERLGRQTLVRVRPDPATPSLLAEIALSGSLPSVASCRESAILTRHTNRRLSFAGPPLAVDRLNEFIDLARDIPGVDCFFCDVGWRRKVLLSLVLRAEAERFRVRSLHDDLFSAVRFDVGWHASAPEGLPPAALGVEPGLRWAFSQLRRWTLMRALGALGLHWGLGFRAAYLPCRLAPHLGVLATRLPPEDGGIRVGRALQRLWLHAESQKLAFQPLAGAALLALHGYQDVRPRTADWLRAGWSRLTADTPLMVFRMGHAPPPAVRAGRLPAAEYLR